MDLTASHPHLGTGGASARLTPGVFDIHEAVADSRARARPGDASGRRPAIPIHRGEAPASSHVVRTSAPELCDLLSIGHNQSVLQNFLSDIPFPIWFAIGCVIVALATHYFKQAAARSKGAVPAPRDVRKAGKEGEWNKLNEHHTPHLRGKREDMATDPQARLLAPSMVYSLCTDEIVNQLKLAQPDAMKTIPKYDSGITDREGLLRRIYSLLRAGYREDLAALREHCARPGWADTEIARLNETADLWMLDWERRWRIRRFLDNDRGIQTVDFAAWDLIRAANLTRAGAGQGWLSEDEAWDTLAVINRALQFSYSSWEETWEAFRITRWLWAAEGDAQTANNDLHDRNRGEFLVGKNGLWTAIPWDAPYPEPRFVLLDAVKEVDKLRCLTATELAHATAWDLELDGQTQARLGFTLP